VHLLVIVQNNKRRTVQRIDLSNPTRKITYHQVQYSKILHFRLHCVHVFSEQTATFALYSIKSFVL